MIHQEEDEDNNDDYDDVYGLLDADYQDQDQDQECYDIYQEEEDGGGSGGGDDNDDQEMYDDDNEYLSENEILDFISNHSQSSGGSEGTLTLEEIYKMEQQIPTLIKDLNSSDDPDEILRVSTEIRKLLQIDNSPFLSKIINSGGLPTFIKLLSWNNYPLIQFECCWILTNLAASTSEHTKLLIDQGVVKPLVKLLNSNDESIRQQACWTLGNITCDSDENRDLILYALPNILEIIRDLNKIKLETVQTVAWTLSNLLRSVKNSPPLEYFLKSLPYLSKLLDYEDEEVLKDTCWSLVYGISQENIAVNSRIQYVIDLDSLLCSKVIKLLYHQNIDIQSPSIRFISFISCGTIDQIKHLLNTRILKLDNNNISIIQKQLNSNNSGGHNNSIDSQNSKSLVSSFYNLLQTPRISHMNDVIWSLSQIITVEKEEINSLIDSGIVPILVNLLNNGDPPIQIDVFLILSNSIVNSKLPKQLLYLISQGCLKSMLNFYSYGQIEVDPSLSNEKLIRILLLCIENILNIFLFNSNKQLINNNSSNISNTSSSSSSSSSYSSSSSSSYSPYQYQQQCIKNIKDSNGILFLSKLQNHSNKFIKDKTINILKKYNKFEIKK